MFRHAFRTQAILLCCAVMCLFVCSKNPINQIPLPNTGKTSNGYFFILSPALGDSIAFYSSMEIVWMGSSKVDDAANLRLSLFDDTRQVCVISPSAPNTGYFTWSASNFGPGEKYRIKICDLSDTQHFDFGDYFSFYSPYNGTITVTQPDSASRLVLDSSFTIHWSYTGFPGSSLKLQLYDDTALVSTIIEGLMISIHTYPWDPVSSARGSGTRYRIKAMSDFDSSIYGFSPYFAITSQYRGGFTVKSPSDTSVWSSGNTYKIRWDTSGHPGPFVALQLYNDSVFVSTIVSSAPDTGSFSWPISISATSGTKYRIKITSVGDASIKAFSNRFTLKGIDPDSYEPDNSRDSASLLTLGTAQNHSITLNDTDWVRFTADSGSGYIIRDSGYASFQTEVSLFYAKENTSTPYDFSNVSGQIIGIWSCVKTGVYYARINSSIGGNTGGYSFKITLFDPATLVSFLTPASASTVTAGSAFAITWVPDPAMLGDNVSFYLYKDNNQIATVTPAAVPNNGSFTWTIPAGFVSGSDYRIKIANAGYRQFFGMSGFFTITGMATDTFEYDGSRDSASMLSFGIAQQHSITLADTDWVRFSPDSGATYLFQVKGGSPFLTAINLFHGTEPGSSSLITSDSSGSASWLWKCGKPAPWYARVNAASSGGYGTYSFKLTKFDSLSSIPFTSPTASSKWYSTVSYAITWTPDTAVFGPTVSLRLVKAGVPSSGLSVTSVPNSGSYSWTVPFAITPGSDYRIKITNAGNTQFFGLSPQFSVSDVMPDSFETDDSRGQASAMALGATQQHTITYADTDWVRFSADSGSRYVIVANGGAGYRISGTLFYNTNVTSEVTFTSGTNGIVQSLWACAKSGTYYSKIASYAAGATGRYSFNVQVFDSSTIAVFTSPASGFQWSTDSAYTVRWTVDTVLFGKLIHLYIYKAGLLESAITSASASNTGSYAWTVPSGFTSGSDYRIRLVNGNNTQIYGYSQVFSIKGMTPDSYEPDNPRTLAPALVFGTPQQHTITYNDTDWVRFSADSGSVYFIRDTGTSAFRTYVYLYYSTDAVAAASNYSLTTGLFVWVWSCVKTGTYYARVTPYTTAATGAYSFTAMKFDTLSSITFTSPVSTSAFTAGASNTITWVPDTGFLGTSVYLYLYKANKLLLSVSPSYISNSGTYSWTPPSGLVTGNDYRIKIANYSNSILYGYSAAFTINGMAADSYEPDNSRGQASALTLGTAQQHTLTYADTDWIQFSADSGSFFSVRIVQAQTNQTRVDLLYGSEASVTSSNYNTFTGTSSWIWKSLKSGTWYARVTPYSSIYGGPYSFLMTKFDSLNTVQFTNPAAAAVVTAGQPLTVTWKPDSIFYGSMIDIYLAKGFAVLPVYIYSGASIDNNGTLTWTPPAGLATGSDYRIRMIDYPNAALVSYSPAFTINGIAPDSYEPDNSRGQATALTLATVQQHSITYHDTDWVRFSADSGSQYIIRDSGDITLNSVVSLYYGTNASTTDNDSSSFGKLTWAWTCAKSGTYYARIYSIEACGSYSFKVTLLDTFNLVTFTNPISTTTWSGGSTYSVSWVPDPALLGSTVSLFLTKGNRNVISLSPSGTPDNGSFSYQVPSGIATGSDYRIKIVNFNSSQFRAYSQAFSINGTAPDSYEPDDAPAQASQLTFGTVQQHTLTYADTDWIKFPTDSMGIYSVALGQQGINQVTVNMLYEANFNGPVSTNNYTGTSSMLWKSWRTCTAYGRVFRYSPTHDGPYSFSISKFDPMSTVQFSNPSAGSVFTAGQAITITWKPDLVFYTTWINLELCRGFDRITDLRLSGEYLNNNGSYTSTLPAGLPSGTDYRIRMVNYPLEAINAYGYSQAFTISGGAEVPADSYEPDNVRGLASTLNLGTAQRHTITYQDTDWVKFSAESGTKYLIQDNCDSTFETTMDLFYETDAAYELHRSTFSLTDVWTWTCTKSGTYFAKIFALYSPSLSGWTGSYSFKVSRFDSLATINFTYPTSTTVISRSSGAFPVTWTPDTVLQGQYLYLDFYKGDLLIDSSRGPVPNYGSSNFLTPNVAGTDYRIKMKRYQAPEIYGYGPYFTIN